MIPAKMLEYLTAIENVFNCPSEVILK
jgi:hypothetical protein